MTQTSTSSRLLSLDILRGITIAGMILVNNPGNWGFIYSPLRHAPWHGMTPTDLIFPFFMFIMGISTYISLKKTNFECTKTIIFKILKRGFLIFLIGLFLAWFGMSLRAWNRLGSEELGFFARLFEATTQQFGNIRIMGVLQRLALTYGICAIIAVTVKHKFIPWIIGIVLLAYHFLLAFGHGFDLVENNIIAVVDRAILGEKHMWGGLERSAGFRFDPEGILSTIPAAMHVLVGFMCGQIILGTKDNYVRIQQLFIVGAILTFAGLLLQYGSPINKSIWSPTFVLATCGMAATLQALLIWIIDIKGHKRWSVFFESFGINPLFMFVFAGILTSIISNILITQADGTVRSLQWIIYNVGLKPHLGEVFGSFVYAVLFVGFNWIIGNILYKKQIYIKI
jgi:predicted acyltransferase